MQIMELKIKTKVPAAKKIMAGKAVNDFKVSNKTGEQNSKQTKKLVKETKQGLKDYGKN